MIKESPRPLTNYLLALVPKAKKEWDSLDNSVKRVLARRLKDRLANPHVPAAALRGARNLYKIKLMTPGFRLVYLVDDGERVLTVLAVLTRDQVYSEIEARAAEATTSEP